MENPAPAGFSLWDAARLRSSTIKRGGRDMRGHGMQGRGMRGQGLSKVFTRDYPAFRSLIPIGAAFPHLWSLFR